MDELPTGPDASAPGDAPPRYSTAVPLGAGGTAEIFRVYDPSLQRDVALKLLRYESPRQIARMAQEARALAQLNHPGICQIYSVVDYGGRPGLALELIEGQALVEVAALGTLDLDARVDIVRQVAAAVGVAHRAGIVHRDLKPDNIMLRRGDGPPQAVVVDFGLVWTEAGADLTLQDQMLGTPGYMAPEQIDLRRGARDHRVDVYGLGATLYHLLCGAPPFEGGTHLEALQRVLNAPAPSVRQHDPTLPAALDAIVQRCLAKSPGARYATADAVAEDLARFQRGESVIARAPRLGQRMWLSWQQRPSMRRALAALVTLVVLGAALLAWQTRRESTKRALAHRYNQMAEGFEWQLRAERMRDAHDLRPAKDRLRARLMALEDELDATPAIGRPALRYALGRGYAALGRTARATQHLETAWSAGHRTPEAAYALGLLASERYRAALVEAQRAGDAEARDVQVAAVRDRYAPIVARYLAHARGADTVPAAYLEALLDYHAGRETAALDALTALAARVPWFYDASILRGDLLAQASLVHNSEGAWDEAKRLADASRAAYDAATRAASSDPRPFIGRCRLATSMLVTHGRQIARDDSAPYYDEAVDACRRAVQLDSGSVAAYGELAFAHTLWAYQLHWRRAGDPQPILDRADRVARAALRVAPASAAAHHAVGRALHYRGIVLHNEYLGDPRPYFDRASVHYRLTMRIEGDSVLLRNEIGKLHLTRGLFEALNGIDPLPSYARAIALLGEVVRAFPNVIVYRSNLASAYINQAEQLLDVGGPVDDAVGAALLHLEHVLAMEPEASMVRLDVARALSIDADARFFAGDDDGAASRMGRALQEVAAVVAQRPEFHEARVRHFLLAYQLAGYQALRGSDPAAAVTLAHDVASHLFDRAVAADDARSRFQALRLHTMAATYDLQYAVGRGDDARAQAADARARPGWQAIVDDGTPIHVYTKGLPYLTWRAWWQHLRGGDPSGDLRTVRRLASEGVDHVPDWAAMYRGMIDLLEAERTADPAAQQALWLDAEEAFATALDENRHLAREIEPWRRLIASRRGGSAFGDQVASTVVNAGDLPIAAIVR
ncbi:MAG: serine/threonine-protein kinase [Acidobacteriota bacterium]